MTSPGSLDADAEKQFKVLGPGIKVPANCFDWRLNGNAGVRELKEEEEDEELSIPADPWGAPRKRRESLSNRK